MQKNAIRLFIPKDIIKECLPQLDIDDTPIKLVNENSEFIGTVSKIKTSNDRHEFIAKFI